MSQSLLLQVFCWTRDRCRCPRVGNVSIPFTSGLLLNLIPRENDTNTGLNPFYFRAAAELGRWRCWRRSRRSQSLLLQGCCLTVRCESLGRVIVSIPFTSGLLLNRGRGCDGLRVASQSLLL